MVDQLHGFDPEARYNAGTQADDCNLEGKKECREEGEERERGEKREECNFQGYTCSDLQ